MGLGDLSRIESAFAEAALDPQSWVRALDIATRETGSFGAILLPITGHNDPKRSSHGDNRRNHGTLFS
jgi:hypothetical protein